MPNKHLHEQNFLDAPAQPPEQPAVRKTQEKKPAIPQAETKHEALPQKEHLGVEEKDNFLEEAIDGMKKKLKRPKKSKPTQIPQVRDELSVKIENIMEEGLEEAFKELPPIERQEFKIKGEETARKIRDLLKSTHVRVKKIFRLLLDWLRMLPGINRFFLEQEAKIKADKIVGLKKHKNRIK